MKYSSLTMDVLSVYHLVSEYLLRVFQRIYIPLYRIYWNNI